MVLTPRLRISIALTNRRVNTATTRSLHTTLCRWAQQRTLSSIKDARVAVLYQALEPPVINGVRKPLKPGGYQDSGADIAFALKNELKIPVLTPNSSPDPYDQNGWCFPDTESGILSAIEKGATHLWANTIVFASHPLQISPKLDRYQSQIRVVGQPPNLVEKFDDKDYLNDLIRDQTNLPMPRAWSVDDKQDLEAFISQDILPFPLVSKPVRGRGSHGVKICKTKKALFKHIQDLFAESPVVMLEEFLQGEEATITVLPPSEEHPDYWAMPVVTRFNHADDIAPYNGVVAVISNSRALTWREAESNPLYKKAARDCEEVARLLNGTAPIRIDIRRFHNDPESIFALFDINMKPNMTGPGRPGRENQASLTGLSALALGWNYGILLSNILAGAPSLHDLRTRQTKLKLR